MSKIAHRELRVTGHTLTLTRHDGTGGYVRIGKVDSSGTNYLMLMISHSDAELLAEELAALMADTPAVERAASAGEDGGGGQ